ncbi:MAG: hypothetical protein VYD90_11070 [Pseudomonadota bacterium]|nr:hypothetical protein [Pseudomonadota bacterium]
MTKTAVTDSLAPSMPAYSAPAPRLSDSQLAAAEAVAAAPLPALELADDQFFLQCLRIMDTLPRQKTDDLTGELRLQAYEIAIGSRPKDAMEFLVSQALRTCRFFPSPFECIEILGRWERNDDALRERRRADAAARSERSARYNEAMTRLATGEATQDEIDAMPDRWKRIGETRSLLWRCDCGSYVLRPRPAPHKPLEG